MRITPSSFARLLLGACLCVASVSLSSSASADETLPTITVVGTHRRPTVVIEVARAKPEIKLKDLQDPKVEKIVRAAATAPF